MPRNDTVHTDFAKFLGEINKGNSLGELSQKLEELVKEVRFTGRGGTLTYVVKITPMGHVRDNDVDQVTVTDDIKLKLPAMKRRDSFFFTRNDNTLTRNNPGQRDFIAEQAEAKKETTHHE